MAKEKDSTFKEHKRLEIIRVANGYLAYEKGDIYAATNMSETYVAESKKKLTEILPLIIE